MAWNVHDSWEAEEEACVQRKREGSGKGGRTKGLAVGFKSENSNADPFLRGHD